jgi:hypothetical protein
VKINVGDVGSGGGGICFAHVKYFDGEKTQKLWVCEFKIITSFQVHLCWFRELFVMIYSHYIASLLFKLVILKNDSF